MSSLKISYADEIIESMSKYLGDEESMKIFRTASMDKEAGAALDTFKKDIPSGNWSTSTQPGQMSNMRHLNNDDLFNSSESVTEEKLDMLISIIADITQKMQGCSQNGGMNEDEDPYGFAATAGDEARRERDANRAKFPQKPIGEASLFKPDVAEKIKRAQMLLKPLALAIAADEKGAARKAAAERKAATSGEGIGIKQTPTIEDERRRKVIANQKADLITQHNVQFPTEPKPVPAVTIHKPVEQPSVELRRSPEEQAQLNAAARMAALAAITPEERLAAIGRRKSIVRDKAEAAAAAEAKRAAERAAINK